MNTMDWTPLVDPAMLAARLHDPRLRLFDARATATAQGTRPGQ